MNIPSWTRQYSANAPLCGLSSQQGQFEVPSAHSWVENRIEAMDKACDLVSFGNLRFDFGADLFNHAREITPLETESEGASQTPSRRLHERTNDTAW